MAQCRTDQTAPQGGRFQVSLVPMLEQRIEKHTLNSVLKISKTGTLSTVFPTKSAPFHYVNNDHDSQFVFLSLITAFIYQI